MTTMTEDLKQQLAALREAEDETFRAVRRADDARDAAIGRWMTKHLDRLALESRVRASQKGDA